MYIHNTQHTMSLALPKIWGYNPGAAAITDAQGRITTAAVAPTLAMNANELSGFIRSEIGVNREVFNLKREVEMLTDPAKAIKDYEDSLKTITDNLAAGVKADMLALMNAGYSARHAEEYAMNSATQVYQTKKQMAMLANPLMTDPGVLLSAAAGVDVRKKAPKVKKAKKAKEIKA